MPLRVGVPRCRPSRGIYFLVNQPPGDVTKETGLFSLLAMGRYHELIREPPCNLLDTSILVPYCPGDTPLGMYYTRVLKLI